MAESSINLPEVEPFTYVLIPSDDSKEVVEGCFDGHTEEELRAHLTRYFRQLLLSPDQMKAMSKHLVESSNEAARKTTVNAEKSEGARNPENESPAEMDPARQKEMIDAYLEQSSYEIIPVQMPMRQTKFIGTSLYIDDCGQFKDLAQNYRASRIAQREIRGDAFLLSNHDDPALDVWRRVDCRLSDYEALYAHPPEVKYDTSNRAQMADAAMLREEETKKITNEDVTVARKGKEDGNRYVSEGDLKAAVQAYALAIERTEGRRDLLPNEAEITELRKSALLNRSLCFQRLGKFSDAAKDAEKAILLDKENPKAYYRLTQALIGSHDYTGAKTALGKFAAYGGSSADHTVMHASIEQGERVLKEQLRKNLAKMFK